jgi:hypothetical protein
MEDFPWKKVLSSSRPITRDFTPQERPLPIPGILRPFAGL